jgi:pyruvate/2-oxoglutarate dehydrogenase complex dihydrolipoamide dehydrogenase (E3) component
MSRIPEKLGLALSQFLKDIKTLNNESAKTHRFSALLAELFPGSKVMTEFSQGVEKVVRVDTAEGEKRRRIDAYYGNAVIEFENSLKVTGKEAERQVREGWQ